MAFKRALVRDVDNISEISPADVLCAGAWVPLATATTSSSATIDFTLTGWNNSDYHAYKVIISRAIPATDNVEFGMRTSTDGGATYDSGASDYKWGFVFDGIDAATSGGVQDSADNDLGLVNLQGNSTNEHCSFEVIIHNPSSTTGYTPVTYRGIFTNSSGNTYVCAGGGYRRANADVDAIRFLYLSGNIASGEFRLYGLKNAT